MHEQVFNFVRDNFAWIFGGISVLGFMGIYWSVLTAKRG